MRAGFSPGKTHAILVSYMRGRCDCSWAASGLGCATPDGSQCWAECCGHRDTQRRSRTPHPSSASPSFASSVCLFILRWGGWPPWAALQLRTMERNPTVRFMIIGDEPPHHHKWPVNVVFHRVTQRTIQQRVQKHLGIAPAGGLAVAGGSSKISDFKPMLAHLFPEKIKTGCDFWGYAQEDELFGDLRAYLDEETLGCAHMLPSVPSALSTRGRTERFARHVCPSHGKCVTFVHLARSHRACVTPALLLQVL